MIIIIGLGISIIIFLPIITEYLLDEEPYFITIKNDEDLEFWSNSGDGTKESPYIIEGHRITIPKNDPDVYDVPCFPENSVISICDITKSFILQNNHIVVKGGCENVQQYIISISDISVPFIIRNNYLWGGYGGIRLHNINGHNSFISNNTIYYSGSYISNSQSISFIHNQYTYSYSQYTYHCSNMSYIQNYYYLTTIAIRECSHVLLSDNIFENDEAYSGWSRLIIWETEYCTITDNTLIRAGLSLRNFDNCHPTAIVSGNLVNGKPFGYFYNQSNIVINSTINYGQIKLVKCNNSIITDQVISETSSPLLIENCIETTVANSTFSHCGNAGVDITSSTNISILDCFFEDNYSGVEGEHSHGIIVKSNFFRELMFGIILEACSLLTIEDNVFENVDSEIRIW
ncbi:MAG: NosD domain-containing protein [Candidatus Hermodarchaeota archaeon]